MRSFIFLSLFFFSLQVFSNIDSLKQILQTTQDSNTVKAYYELGKVYRTIDLDSAKMFSLEGALLAENLDFTRGKILTYRLLGDIYPKIQNYDDGRKWLGKAIRLVDSLELGAGQKVDLLTNYGVSYYREGLIGKAIETYIEAVEICNENEFDGRKSRLLNNLGVFYRMLEQYDDAIGIYEQSLKLRTVSNDTMGMANTLFNMAAAYAKIEMPQKAIASLDKAESLFIVVDSGVDVLACKVAKGTALVDLEQWNAAQRSFDKARKHPNIETLPNFYIVNLYHGLAKIASDKRNYSLAEKYLKNAEDYLDREGYEEQSLNQMALLSNVYEAKGQYKLAFENLAALKNRTDTINNEDRLEFRQEMETKYLATEKEYEIDLLSKDNELKEVKLKASSQRLIGMGIGLVLIGGLLVWVFYLFKKMKNQNAIISKSNREKEILLKEIHHRVKNNLQVVSSLLTLQSKYVDDSSALDAINTGKSRVQSMSILHRNLYQNENLKNIKIKPYFEDLIQNLVSTYKLGEKEISIRKEVDDIELDVDTVIPIGLISNELISNALKYAFVGKDKGEIDITLKGSNGKLLLVVKDDGIGLPFTEIPKRSKTLGMQLIHSFAKKLEAEIQIDNISGTEISFEIPIMDEAQVA